MDEDIFPELCIMNAKKTYSKPFKKLLRTPQSNNVNQALKPVEKKPQVGKPLTTKDAVEYLLNGKLKSAVCRYCLKESPGLSELDMIMQIAGTGTMYKVTIREMIACFYPYKAGEDENFPNKICQRCLDKAINAYLFTQQCEQAERALLNCLDDMYEKLEKLDPLDRPKKRGRQKLNPNYNVLYAEHEKVINYAEPIRNIINIQAESLTKEPDWNELECKKCWQVLPNIESLLNHEKIHPKHMWYHCRLCGKSFIKHNHLKKHYTKVHLQGKGNDKEVDKNFKCNECGNITDDYAQHLQHVEKHKYKTIMKHLIEKKTDQLCLICLNKRTDLVELDKTVCIHGGYPELVGDKSLYTVLASTLPDHKSYKYQELYVPHKANIMTISKRKRKASKNLQNILKIAKNADIKYDLSPPIIVYKYKFRTNDFYYYVFCDPQTDNEFIKRSDNMNINSPRIVEITDQEPMDINKDLNDKITDIGKEKSYGAINPNTGVETADGDKDPVNLFDNTNSDIEMVANKSEPADITTHGYHKIITNDLDTKEVIDDKESMDLNKRHYPVDKTLLDDKQPAEEKNEKDIEIMNVIDSNCNEDIIIQSSFEELQMKMFSFSKPVLIEVDDKCSSILNETKLNVDSSFKFHFSYPHNDQAMDEEMPNFKQETLTSAIKDKFNYNWIFSKALGKCDLYKDIKALENTDEFKPKKTDCKFCWLFEHLNKCEYCNTPIEKGADVTNMDNQNIRDNDFHSVIKDNIETNAENEAKIYKSIVVPKTSEKYTKEPKIEKTWQCNVCLTINNNDRFTCYCCESKKYLDNETCKVTFRNKTFFDTTHKKEVIDIDMGVLLDVGTIPMMDFKIVSSKNNAEIQVTNTKDSTQIMDMETEPILSDTNISSQNDVEMDVEEISPNPNIAANFSTAPINLLTANIAPYVGTNVHFNIGSNTLQQGETTRKLKRPLRRMPKAFHK